MTESRDDLDRLIRLNKKAQDAGLDKTPEDRAMLRLLMDKIALTYARLLPQHLRPKDKE